MEFKYVLLVQAAAAVFTDVLATHRSQHSTETDVFKFHYDPDTGLFVGTNRITCILVLLNAEEREEVHTTRGIERIELKMMKNWMGVLPEVMVYRTDPLLSPHLLHWCDNKHIIMLQRALSNTIVTGPTSPSRQTTTVSHATFSGTPSLTSGTNSSYEQTTFSTSAGTSISSTHAWSENSIQNMNMFSSPSLASSSVTMAAGATTETTIGTSTLQVPASATSYHTMKVTTPSVIEPYIIYDNSPSQVNAVIVNKNVCYVYRLSDMDKTMINMGPDIRDAFERALLSRDKTNSSAISGHTNFTSDTIRRTCMGTVFQLN